VTLKQIIQRIQESQQMASSDPTTALKMNRELFTDLVRQDQVFLVPEAEVSESALEQKLFRPYIGPAQENDPRLFLRIFSHQDVAESFAERLGRNQICKIDGVELMQLAKTYFLRGVYGFLLNDGLAWTALSFPDFLVDCFQCILGDPSLARPEYISLIQFINMVRQNKYYHIQAGHLSVVDAAKPLQVRFMDRPQSIWSNEVGEWLYEDCTIDHLIRASGLNEDAVINIKTTKAELQISPAQLRAALVAAGLAEPGTQFDLDFHTSAIALDYRLEDFDLERLPLQVQLAELPRLDSDSNENEEHADTKPQKKRRFQPFAFLFKKRKSQVKSPNTEGKSESKEEEVLDLPSQSDDQDRSKEGTKKRTGKKKLSPKMMVYLFFMAAFLIIAAAILMQFFKPVPKDKLEKAIQSNDYVQAVELYNKGMTANPGSQEELLQLLSKSLDDLLAGYAADKVTANQLAEAITTYEKIPAMANKCDTVYTQASALEQSKITYQEGLLETAMSKRLEVWRGVIAADIGSQASIRAALDNNAETYKAFVFAEVDQMEVGEALRYLNILQSYYPNDNEIAKEIKEWLDEVSVPAQKPQPGSGAGVLPGADNHDWPVVIRDITVSNEEGPYDLFIRWGNVSGQTINRVLFNVTPLSAAGEAIGRDYSAIAQGPYENGYEMPDTYFWPSAWDGLDQEIAAVRLNSIQVWYNAGTQDGDDESWSMYEPVQYGELLEQEDNAGQESGKESLPDFFDGLL